MKNVPDGWQEKDFLEVFKDDTAKKKKIPTNDYLDSGNIPIIDQGKKAISGYTNDSEALNTNQPIIIFGDHTRALKYIDFDFSIGADGVKVLKNIEHSSNTKYLYYALLHKPIPNTGYNRHFKYLKRIQIPIPPLPQQEKIVKVLDISSALIEKQKELIESYDLFLKSKFIEMFGDPILNPMGWEVQKIGNSILDVKNGLTRRGKTNSGDIVLKLKNIRENYIRFENLNRINLDEKEKEKFIAQKNDLLFIRVNGNPDYVGRCAVYNGYTEEVYFNDHIMRIKIDTEKYNAIFLGFIVNSPYGKKQILKYRKTSAGQHTISQDGLERLLFYLPPINLQNKFARIVEKIETIKTKETKKLNHLETLHKSLMDRAFKGEIQ